MSKKTLISVFMILVVMISLCSCEQNSEKEIVQLDCEIDKIAKEDVLDIAKLKLSELVNEIEDINSNEDENLITEAKITKLENKKLACVTETGKGAWLYFMEFKLKPSDINIISEKFDVEMDGDYIVGIKQYPKLYFAKYKSVDGEVKIIITDQDDIDSRLLELGGIKKDETKESIDDKYRKILFNLKEDLEDEFKTE